MTDYVIGIDVGTQGTHAALMASNGTILAEKLVPSRLIRPAPDQVEQDPEEMLSSALQAIQDVLQASGCQKNQVVGLALAGQMAGIMGVGADGMAVTPYDSWLDQRCGAYWETMRQIGEDQIIAITGGPITYAHGPKILWWKNERPDVYDKITAFVQPAAYLAMRLCELSGREAFIDPTYLHFTGFADTQKKTWSQNLLSEAGVDPQKMPRIVRSQDIIGKVSPAMARATGLAAGTPVAAGCGDTAASILGAGVTRPGMAIDVSGTASVFGVAVREFRPDIENRTLLYAPSVIDDLYTPMAYINGGGLCLKWLRDDVFATGPAKLSYKELDAMAAQVPYGSDRLLFLPHFSGRVCPNDGRIRGSFIGLSWSHGQAHLFRSVMESIGYEYAMYRDILSQRIQGLAIEQVINVGGGAKSPLMRQIKSDILGIPWTAAQPADTGVLGIGIVAGLAVGLFEDPAATANDFIEHVAVNEPDRKAGAAYEPLRLAYRESFDALRPVYDRLLPR